MLFVSDFFTSPTLLSCACHEVMGLLLCLTQSEESTDQGLFGIWTLQSDRQPLQYGASASDNGEKGQWKRSQHFILHLLEAAQARGKIKYYRGGGGKFHKYYKMCYFFIFFYVFSSGLGACPLASFWSRA